MSKKPIFIHIPKTGGTSINCMMQETDWQTIPDYHYRHIIYQTKQSNSGDIFDQSLVKKYKQEFIFTMLRHPVDRLVSEYFFLRKHDEFMSLLESQPSSFEEFIELKQTSNYMLKFLNGDYIYDEREMDEKRADEIIASIDELDIHVGIYEHFDLSLNYFTAVGGFEWPKKIEIKRATINRPHIKSISKSVQQKILKNNALDLKLYQHCLDKLLVKSAELPKTRFQYKGDKFEHILPYTTRFCILEIELQDMHFVEVNKSFLMTLNVYLHKSVKTGKEYSKKWVKLFKEHVAYYYPGTKFAKNIKQVKRSTSIDEIIAIAQVIDVASKDMTLSLEIEKSKMQFRMNASMEKVFTDEGIRQAHQPIW